MDPELQKKVEGLSKPQVALMADIFLGLADSAVVRTHSIDGQDYQPDGWFGCASCGMPVTAEVQRGHAH